MLALVQKPRGIESIATWKPCRTARSAAAHDYDIDDAVIAVDFNQLNALRPSVPLSAKHLVAVAKADLGTEPATNDFVAGFQPVIAQTNGMT